MSLDRPELVTRKPTGAVPWPLLLVEGPEKSGKSWAAALLTSSPRVGQSYWLDLGEGAADEYAAIPDVAYDVLVHDGTYAHVLERVLAVKAEAARAAAAGEPPVVLVIDSATDVWEGLKDWVSQRAKEKPSNQRKLAEDPAAELDVPRNLWNDAAGRYRRLMTVLLTFPGIVVMTARGKPISATDPATGQPYRDGRKSYSVESHKTLPYDATLWLRLSRDDKPVVVGARSVHAGVKPGEDDPQPILEDHNNLLDWLVFDVLKCDPAGAHARDLRHLTGGALTEDEQRAAIPESAPAARGVPAQDQWQAPIETDAEWLKGWRKAVTKAAPEEMQPLWADLGAHVKSLTISEGDREAAQLLWTQRRTVHQRTAPAEQEPAA